MQEGTAEVADSSCSRASLTVAGLGGAAEHASLANTRERDTERNKNEL